MARGMQYSYRAFQATLILQIFTAWLTSCFETAQIWHICMRLYCVATGGTGGLMCLWYSRSGGLGILGRGTRHLGLCWLPASTATSTSGCVL